MLETKLMRHLQCTGNYPLGGAQFLFCPKQVCATKRGVSFGVLLTFEQSNTCLSGPGTLEVHSLHVWHQQYFLESNSMLSL